MAADHILLAILRNARSSMADAQSRAQSLGMDGLVKEFGNETARLEALIFEIENDRLPPSGALFPKEGSKS